MIALRVSLKTSFAHRELVAPVGLWERGAEASGYILPSARLFPSFQIQPRHFWRVRPVRSTEPTSRAFVLTKFWAGLSKPPRASKAFATSPSGETPAPGNLADNGDARCHSDLTRAYIGELGL